MARRPQKKTICLVTEELALSEASGGIGGAFLELATLLAPTHKVTVLYCPVQSLNGVQKAKAIARLEAYSVRLLFLDAARFSHQPDSLGARSYGVFRQLQALNEAFDFIHFHDYKGLGYHSLCARDQGIAFETATMVVQLHGPVRWTIEQNETLFTEPEQLKADFMERQSVARADYLISPSRYMLSWLDKNGWVQPPAERRLVIGNVCGDLVKSAAQRRRQPTETATPNGKPISEIIYFGRQEHRKGFTLFCDALDRIADQLEKRKVAVTFLGGFGVISGRHSINVLAARAKTWGFRVNLMPFENRSQAADYLSHADAGLVVVPSPAENSPYAVLEAVLLGRPVLTSTDGGAGELLEDSVRSDMTCEMSGEALGERLLAACSQGMPKSQLARAAKQAALHWRDFHSKTPPRRERLTGKPEARPRVSVCVTHYERPEKLIDAITSISRQTYSNIELVVVDDGSPNPETQRALVELEPSIAQLGGVLVRRANGYLGAARNTAAAAASGEYLCFLDDDDIAFPRMVETLVSSALHTEAEIVTCMQINMSADRRAEAWPAPDLFADKVDYHPLGGPLALAPIENLFGPPTALISRDVFNRVGGYTPLRNTGYEDFEFFVKAVQEGIHIELCPLPLYLYEVGRPSMITMTSALRNSKRVMDAVDIFRNQEAWRDFMCLQSGLRAAEAETRPAPVVAENGDRRSPSSEIARTGSPELILAQLAEFCAETGSHAVETACRVALQFYVAQRRLGNCLEAADRRALLAAARRSAAAGDTVEFRQPPKLKRQIGVRLALRQECANGSPTRLLELVSRALGAGEAASSDIAFLTDADLPLSSAEKLIDALIQGRSSEEGRSVQVISAFLLAARAGLTADANALFNDLLALDEVAYLRANPDVAAAVQRGRMADGMQHYLLHGQDEGRAGFASALRALRLYNRAFATQLTPLQLMRHLAPTQEM